MEDDLHWKMTSNRDSQGKTQRKTRVWLCSAQLVVQNNHADLVSNILGLMCSFFISTNLPLYRNPHKMTNTAQNSSIALKNPNASVCVFCLNTLSGDASSLISPWGIVSPQTININMCIECQEIRLQVKRNILCQYNRSESELYMQRF